MKRSQLALALLLLSGLIALRLPRPLPGGWTLLRPPHASFVLLEEGDTMWVGGWEGLYHGNAEGLTRVDAGARLQYVRALWRDRQGVLWIGHNAGLSWRGPHGFEHRPGPAVSALAEDSRGRLYVGTDRGLLTVEGDQMAPITLPGPEQRVSCLLVDRSDALWVGTGSAFAGGVYRRSADESWQALEGLPHPHVNCLVEDSQGGMWVGTGYLEDGGVCRYVGLDRELLWTQSDGLPGSNVRSVLVQETQIFLGMEYAGLAVGSQDRWRRLGTIDGLPHQEVLALRRDRRDRLWVATRDGVLVLTPDAWRSLR